MCSVCREYLFLDDGVVGGMVTTTTMVMLWMEKMDNVRGKNRGMEGKLKTKDDFVEL